MLVRIKTGADLPEVCICGAPGDSLICDKHVLNCDRCYVVNYWRGFTHARVLYVVCSMW